MFSDFVSPGKGVAVMLIYSSCRRADIRFSIDKTVVKAWAARRRPGPTSRLTDGQVAVPKLVDLFVYKLMAPD